MAPVMRITTTDLPIHGVIMKVFSDTANHLFSGRTISAKTLKRADSQISPNPTAETTVARKRHAWHECLANQEQLPGHTERGNG